MTTELQPEGAARRGTGVVVLNWNGADDTLACLDSLLDAEPRPDRVAVVDNASRDDSVARVRGWAAARGVAVVELLDDAAPPALDGGGGLPWLVLVRLSEHRGFAGGNNAGVRALLGCQELTHFLLLNNDAVVERAYFRDLATALHAAPDAALLCGTIYEFTDRNKVWYAGGRSIPWRALVLHHDTRPADDAPRPTEFITGCALVISRPAIARLGLLPECYFPIYVEDAEYSLRARAAGLAVLYAPRPTVYHKIGATTGRADVSPKALYLLTRHRAFYVRRNLRGPQRVAAIAYLAMTKPVRALLEVARGRPAMAGAILRGAVTGLVSRDAYR